MCDYIKTRFPHVYLYTSTNGLAFTEDRARRLVHTGIDEVTFSLDGAIPEHYAEYRRRGDLETALRHLRAMADEKQRAARDVPFINWRYILFKWNDSDEEIDLARRLASKVGADRLTWELTDHPEEAFSRRFRPGSLEVAQIRYEILDDNNLRNAIPGATPRARIVLTRLGLRLPLISRPGGRLSVSARVSNLSRRAFPAHRRFCCAATRITALSACCTANPAMCAARRTMSWRTGRFTRCPCGN